MIVKHKRNYFSKIINLVFIFWLFLSPFFWHFDVSHGKYGFYDLVSNYNILHLIVFYILGAMSLSLNRRSLWPIMLFAMYFPIIQLVNYPYLTIRDVYLHATPAKSLITNGTLLKYNDAEVSSWPGSFCLHGIFTIISGIDLVTANYILYFVLVAVVAFVIYLFGRLTHPDCRFNLIWLAAPLFIGFFFNHLFDNFHHYSRTSLAFTLLFFFFFSFFRLTDHRGLLLKFLLVCAILITHPFQSLALVAFLLIYTVLNFEVKSVSFALFSFVGFVSWILFQGASIFYEAVSRLTSFLSSEYLQPVIETLPTKETLPWVGILLREYFKYSFLGLFSCVVVIAVIYISFKRRKLDSVLLGLVSFLFSSIVVMLCLLLLPDWHIARFTPFAAFPIAFSFFVIFDKLLFHNIRGLTMSRRKSLSSNIVPFLSLLFVISLLASVTVLRFEKNYYFGEMYHPSEMYSLTFFSSYANNSTLTALSWRTSIYSIYFNENFTYEILRVWYLDLKDFGSNASKVICAYTQLISKSNFVIRGLRDNYTLGGQFSGDYILQAIDNELESRKFGIFYSNGYYSLLKNVSDAF